MTPPGRPIAQSVRRPVSADAVVVIPGIMGSTLRQDGRVLWGLDRLGWYWRAWRSERSLFDDLALTPQERAGEYGRVAATGLLKMPAFSPFLRGVEPYTRLLTAISRVVADPAAVLEFAYDWRLPVGHNALLLAEAARTHLDAWRAHHRYVAMLRALPDTRPAQLVLVAHSMGGLLVRALPDDLDVRATATLGTPFDGAAKAALILNAGRGAPVPLPRAKLRDIAATMPGLHDLLPVYRCLDDLDHDHDPRRLTPDDVAALGGDRELAEASSVFHDRTAENRLPGHHALIGTSQPTVQSLSLHGGVVSGHRHTFRLRRRAFERDSDGVLVRRDEHGDGTVPHNSSLPPGFRPATLAQQHGALAASPEAIEMVCAVITERDPHAERLGGGDLGVDVPDLVHAGVEFVMTLTGIDGPTDATVTVHDQDGVEIDHPPIRRAGGRWEAVVLPPAPGMYRITVDGAGTAPVTQLTMADGPP